MNPRTTRKNTNRCIKTAEKIRKHPAQVISFRATRVCRSIAKTVLAAPTNAASAAVVCVPRSVCQHICEASYPRCPRGNGDNAARSYLGGLEPTRTALRCFGRGRRCTASVNKGGCATRSRVLGKRERIPRAHGFFIFRWTTSRVTWRNAVAYV